MGRKTYESIGKALPNRTNIVVSRKENWFEENILIVSTLKEAIKFAKKIDEDIFIIGGGDIYGQTIELADRLEITRVNGDFEADTFFHRSTRKLGRKRMKNAIPKTIRMIMISVFRLIKELIKTKFPIQILLF
jgi:dihydrofolate reductase